MRNKEMRAERLKEAREAAGLTQAELASFAGISLSLLRSYEQGQRSINEARAVVIHKLSRALGTSMEELLEVEE